MNKGFGVIGLLITLTIIGVIVWGAFYLNKGITTQSQINESQSQIQSAKDAANQENQYNQNLQDLNSSLDTGGGVNYRAATKGLK